MPSMTHEALLLLFRNRPELAAELLRDVLGVALPIYAEARVEAADFSDVVPAEYRADLVVLLIDGKPVLAIVVEAQLQKDDRKPFTWPVYIAGLRARFECPACVLVITPSETIADWARSPIYLGPGGTLVPSVVGPKSVPVVHDHTIAKRDPELVVLSAMAHGKEEVGLQIATAAFEACRGLDDDRAMLYLDLVGISLSDVARAAFEDLMATGNYEFQSDFAKKHRAAGRAEGLALGEASAVITVLRTRGIALSAEHEKRILACADLDTLREWIQKAVTVGAVEELFAD